MNRIDIKEFRERGYLQELNRRFLHPLGLALEVVVDNGEEKLGGIWDYREDKEGIYYNIKESDNERISRFKENKEFIDEQFNSRGSNRKSELGFNIEPIPNSPESYDDKYLNLMAEFDNYKKRTAKEKEDLVNNTKVKMLSSILDMDSDISIAIKSVQSEEAKEGLNLIASKVESFLKSQGIEPIQTETYDNELHEVISMIEIGESKIVDVISKGYTLNEKPFRYPKIILGK